MSVSPLSLSLGYQAHSSADLLSCATMGTDKQEMTVFMWNYAVFHALDDDSLTKILLIVDRFLTNIRLFLQNQQFTNGIDLDPSVVWNYFLETFQKKI